MSKHMSKHMVGSCVCALHWVRALPISRAGSRRWNSSRSTALSAFVAAATERCGLATLCWANSYASLFTDAGWTGEQLMAVKSDAPLKELGVYSEVDRSYLWLQVTRVRDFQRAERRRQMGVSPSVFSHCGPTIMAPAIMAQVS